MFNYFGKDEFTWAVFAQLAKRKNPFYSTSIAANIPFQARASHFWNKHTSQEIFWEFIYCHSCLCTVDIFFYITLFFITVKNKFGQHNDKFWGYEYNDLCYKTRRRDKTFFLISKRARFYIKEAYVETTVLYLYARDLQLLIPH